jgi:tRNA-specific adenosine deaminase 1
MTHNESLLPDRIATVVQEQYSTLVKHQKTRSDVFEWTVVAGIVLEDKDNNNCLDCIAIGTGTRVVGEERLKLVPNGGALADCHAEVLCRRAFCRFLLDQIVELNRKSSNESFWIEKEPEVINRKL